MTFFFKTDKSVILITTKCFGKFDALTAGTGVRRGGRQLTPLVWKLSFLLFVAIT
jgi:hypothetical protein